MLRATPRPRGSDAPRCGFVASGRAVLADAAWSRSIRGLRCNRPACRRRPDATVEPVMAHEAAYQEGRDPFRLKLLAQSPAAETDQRPQRERREEPELSGNVGDRTGPTTSGHRVREIQVLHLVM